MDRRKCKNFEKEFADFSGSNFAIAVSNGTTALDLALHGLRIGQSDEVIVTSRTFLASVSSIINAGAVPVFADVCFETQNITADTVANLISTKTKTIMCVHLAGWPCDMDPIMDLAESHGLLLLKLCSSSWC